MKAPPSTVTTATSPPVSVPEASAPACASAMMPSQANTSFAPESVRW